MATKKTDWLSKDMTGKDLWITRVATVLLGFLALTNLVLGAIVPRVGAWITGAPLVFTSGAEHAGPPVDEALRAGASARWAGEVEYTVTNPTALQRFGDLIAPVVLFVLILVGFAMVWRLLDRVAAGDPFHADAMRTFRGLSLLLGLGAICLPLVAFAGRFFALADSQQLPHVYSHVAPETVAVALTGLAGAGLVEVLGLVFRRGAELRRDTEGLV
ncbi:DUF2975 domain-containing protein [Mariniluteicoccus flavus]